MADIKYGGDKADYQDALARMRAQEAQVGDTEKATRKLREAEGESSRAGESNAQTRRAATTVITDQTAAIEASAAALRAETSLLNANTAAWVRVTEARAGAGASAAAITPLAAPAIAGSKGATSVGYSAELAQFEAQNARVAAAAGRAAQLAAADAAATAAVQAQASKYLGARGISAAGGAAAASPAERALQAVKEDPGLHRAGNFETGLGQFGPRAATADEKTLIANQAASRAELARTETQLASTSRAWRLANAETAAASQAMIRHGALSTEFIQSLARGEVTLKEFGTALTSTIGKFAGWAVAGGLVYGAFEALKQVARGATETATGVAQLERAQLPDFNRGKAEQGFREVAARTNVPIRDVAEAQFYAARAGFHTQSESLNAGETAILAQKLDQVPIQEAAKSLGALHIAFGLNAQGIRQVFNELDVGQLKFNARLNQTLPQMGRAASAFANAGGSAQQLARQLVEITGATGGGGGQGGGNPATFLLREATNLSRPQAIATLKEFGLDARRGAGDIGKFNEEIQERAKSLSQDQRREVARAIGAGGAQGGRYGIALVEAGPSGRAAEVTAGLTSAGNSAQEDLNKKLGQFDEKFSAIGHTFERVGSELGAAGVTHALEDLFVILKEVGQAAGFVAGPLKQIGSVFSSLPGALQQLVVGGGVLAGVSKAGGFNALATSKDRDYVNAAKRTTNVALADQEASIERRTKELKSATTERTRIADEKARFEQGVGAPFLAGDVNAVTEKERSLGLQRQNGDIQERYNAALARETQVTEKLVTERGLQETLVRDNRVAESNLPLGQKAEVLRQRGLIVAQGGLGSTQPHIGPNGELIGSAYAGKANVDESERRFLAGRGVSVPVALDETAAGVERGGAALDSSLATAARVQTEGAGGLREALGIAGTQVREGGTALYEAMTQAAVAMFTFGRQASLGEAATLGRGGAREIFGGIGTGAGSLGQKIGENALKGVMYAFVASAVAEVGGELATSITGSKKIGSVVSGIGGDIAVGTGIGALFGEPILGAGIGALAGIADQAGIFGGGSGPEGALRKKIVEDKQKKLVAQAEAAGSPTERNEVYLDKAAESFGEELEVAFGGESEAAKKALATVEQRTRTIAAGLKLYGPDTQKGREFAGLAGAQGTASVLNAVQNPNTLAQSAENLERQVSSRISALQGFLKGAVKGGSPETILAAGRTVAVEGQNLYNSLIANPRHGIEQTLEGARKSEQQALAALQKSLAEPKSSGSGTHPKEAELQKKYNAATQEVERVQKQLDLFNQLAKVLDQKINEFAHEEVGATILGALSEKETSANARILAEAGPDPASKARVQKQIEGKARDNLQKTEAQVGPLPEQRKKLDDEQAVAAIKAREEQNERRLQDIDTHSKRELAELPVGAPASAASGIREKAARAKLAFLQSVGPKERSGQQLRQAEIELDEARRAREQAVATEADNIISLRGQITQASLQGNALAQAQAAGATAAELLSHAKGQEAHLKAQVGVIQAANQLQQAVEQRIAAAGELQESTEASPLEKTATKIGTLRQQLGAAKGPDERTRFQAAINNELRAFAQAQVSEREETINFHEQMGEISKQQAIAEYKALLRMHGITAQTRRDVLLKIRQLEKATSGEEGAFSFAPGSIKLPTVYDVRRSIEEQARAGAPRIVGEFAQRTTGAGPLGAAHIVGAPHTSVAIHNSNSIVVHVHSAADVKGVESALEKVTGAHLHTRLRKAGLRGI